MSTREQAIHLGQGKQGRLRHHHHPRHRSNFFDSDSRVLRAANAGAGRAF